jgi:hypothetical protein
MNIDQAFPSKYLSSEDLEGREIRVTIARVEIEEVGRDRDKKPILYFTKAKKGMVLNKTNAKMIKAAYGNNTDEWEDREIIIFSMKVQFGDEIVDGIRVKIPTQRAAPPAPRKPIPIPQAQIPEPASAEPPPWDDRVDDIGDTF